jgi:hypothetical protein
VNKRITSHGYVVVHVGEEHHLADLNGYAYEHRVVAEKKLGRRLRAGEVVHHLNEVKTDNRPENLEVMASRWHHNVEHRKLDKVRQDPGQPNEEVACACGCGELIWRFNIHHLEVRFISGHNGRLNKKERAPKPKQGEYNRVKTHCPAGHEYDEANTRWRGTHRICRACHRQREAARQERRREEVSLGE